jgi:hypothetical protein
MTGKIMSPPSVTYVPTPAPMPSPLAFSAKEVSFNLNAHWSQQAGEAAPFLDNWEAMTHLKRAGDTGKTACTVYRSPSGTTLEAGFQAWWDKMGRQVAMDEFPLGGKTVRRGYWAGALDGGVPGNGIDYMIEVKPFVYLISTRYSSALEGNEILGEGLALLASFKAEPVKAVPVESANHFPMSDGATWTYRLDLNGKAIGTSTNQLGAVASSGGVVTAKVAITTQASDAAGQSIQTKAIATYRKTTDELTYETADGVKRLELKLPLEPGKAWKDAGMDVTVEGPVVLDVPYKQGVSALKVVAKVNGTVVATNWYASGFGLVRGEAIDQQGNKTVLELTAYRYLLFSDARPDRSNPIQ